MRVALGSDAHADLVTAVARVLLERGIDVELFGALVPGAETAWPSVGRAVGEAVSSEACAFGVVCCWTGTGVSIAANKVRGVRAALCGDAETATGARTWNDANVLALSLRATSVAVGREIVRAFLDAEPSDDPADAAMIVEVKEQDLRTT